MPTAKSPDEVKCIFAFLLTLKQIPFIYYGDEIGMEHNYAVSKDGGGIRTGARTPMPWTDGENKGFSVSKELYLPVSDKKGVDVESQQNAEDSLLNTVKKLIGIKKSNSCFNVSSGQKFKKTGYPCVFERYDENSTATVMINPTDKEFKVKRIRGEILLSNNASVEDKKIILGKESFVIIKSVRSRG